MKQTREQFITFLKDDGAYDAFMENLLTADCAEDFLYNAFTWDGTKQGHNYWMNVDYAWRKHYGETGV